MRINTKHDLSAITECAVTEININLKSRKILNTKVNKNDKLFQYTKEKKMGISIEIKDHHKNMSIEEFSTALVDPIVLYMAKEVDKYVFKQIFKSSAKSYISDDVFGLKYDVNIQDSTLKEHYCSRFKKSNGINLDDAHKARLSDRIIKLQKLIENVDFDGVILVDEFMANNTRDSFEKIQLGISTNFLKADLNNELPPFWKGVIVGKDAVELFPPMLDQFEPQNGPSCTSSDGGISVRSTIAFEPSVMKTFLHIDFTFCCLVDKSKIIFLKEEGCIMRDKARGKL